MSMNKQEQILTHHLGEKCKVYEKGCANCEIRGAFEAIRKEERERSIEKSWNYIVKATRAESWSKEELEEALTNNKTPKKDTN